ncbi:unnamed protein product [Blumeria hordei]|uniref:RNA helicase n=1 Tax=Blumeria hordei TaxID=2867405 RepID=A0A383UM83_BLUHO|nr:unnamed protein product [Blumeria hordei]
MKGFSSSTAVMKRKLDVNNVPSIKNEIKEDISANSFSEFGLDARILQAVAKQNFKHPTSIQAHAIPTILDGRDVLARARTGSGKTAAYLLPIIHSILKRKLTSSSNFVSTIILVPTRELADQAQKVTESLCVFCAKDVRAVNLTLKVSDAVQQSLLADLPDIVITTPARASIALTKSYFSADNVNCLVIDEADLVLSYGYEEDLQNISRLMPKGVQTILMSATLTSEVETLKGLFCREPAIIKLDEKEDDGNTLSQYVVKCAEDDKFLLIYVIFKLKLIKGKCIVFVGEIDRCYRLKLFLEQFGIKSCILSSELPVNSRIHVVEEFNKGVYDIIIASDELEALGDEDDVTDIQNTESQSEPAEGLLDGPKSHDEPIKTPALKKRRKLIQKDKDYGVSRGIDFKNVACVLNFDLPTSSRSYTHRIGRTARAGQTGMAISFVIPSDQYRKHPPISVKSTEKDEKVLAKITKQQNKNGLEIKPYNFDMEQLESFRYRLGDAMRAVTTIAIREARTREIRQELIKSEKLKRHFEENPDDLHHLRHDGELRPARVQAHMKNVPDYLLPEGGKKALSTGTTGYIGLRVPSENRIRKARMANRSRGTRKKSGTRKSDPLKTFRAKVKS